MPKHRRALYGSAVALAFVLSCTGAGFAADSAPDFSGKRITIVVGYGTGGAYDLYARLLAQFMGRYLRGSPTIVVENMPGAGSLRAVNYLYSVAPKDGTVFGTFARPMALMSVLGGIKNMTFDASKFVWLGSASNYDEDAYLLFVRPDASIKSVADARKPGGRPLLIGETGTGASDVPLILKEELGFNLKVISGYQDAHEIYLAVDRREVDARATDYSGVKSGWPQWLKPGAMNVLVQFGRIDRHPDFPNVPTARELAPTPQAREIIETDELPYRMSRPFAAPPGTPAPIAAALRSAFMQAMKNPELRAQATKMGLGITPISGQEVEAVINRMRRAPKPVLDQLRRLETAAE